MADVNDGHIGRAPRHQGPLWVETRRSWWPVAVGYNPPRCSP